MSRRSKTTGLLALVPDESRAAVRTAARETGVDAAIVGSVSDLLEQVRERAWSATLLSLSSEHGDEALARRLAAESHTGALLLSTEHVTLSGAVGVERIGATALLREPLSTEALVSRLARIAEESPEVLLPDLPAVGDDDEGIPTLVGRSPQMASVIEQIAKVGRSDTTVLVSGESGTGKEVVARALHWTSDRSRGPFIAVNCAAIPEHLLESELFGHERGAFTGAVARRVGRFERANGGTLFLDEIGDMSLVLQAKVLRALEEREVDPVGGEEGRPVDVRVVAATNRDIRAAIEQGTFREDLYYRLAVVELHLPPLRERRDDVRELSLHFGSLFAHAHGRPVRAITEAALARLEAEPWPGNVRELRNVMDRAVLLADGPAVGARDLRLGEASARGAPIGPHRTAEGGYDPSFTIAEVEEDHIRRVLASVNGQMGRAAEVLGIHRNTLTRKMQSYHLDELGEREDPR